MFDSKRFVTAGVSSTIDLNVQLFIWNRIEELKGKIQLDYLQVFELTKIHLLGRFMQKIVHTQEIPYHRQEYIINAISPIDAMIYVIDDETHCTMLISNEY